MEELNVRFKREIKGMPAAKHAHKYDAGYDLYAIEDKWVLPFQTKLIKSNIKMEIPPGYMLRIGGRSGMALDGWETHHGTIDSGYVGNVGIILRNMKLWPKKIEKGQRIAQATLIPISYMALKEAHQLKVTSRGDSGFGASGKF